MAKSELNNSLQSANFVGIINSQQIYKIQYMRCLHIIMDKTVKKKRF
jgi:hypothetical protein